MPIQVDNDGETAVVHPGDYIVGDLNGVVCIPAALVQRTIALIAPQVEADAKIAKELQNGVPFVEASRKHRVGLKGSA